MCPSLHLKKVFIWARENASGWNLKRVGGEKIGIGEANSSTLQEFEAIINSGQKLISKTPHRALSRWEDGNIQL
jgi:hypothetical protein